MKYHYNPPPELYEVEASRWFKDGDHPAVEKMHGAGTRIDEACGCPSYDHGWLKNPDRFPDGEWIAASVDSVCPGDWIVMDSRGGYRKFSPESFSKFFQSGPSPFRSPGKETP